MKRYQHDGKITMQPEYTVWCINGDGYSDYYPAWKGQKEAIRLARLDGWRLRDGEWYCPKCAATKISEEDLV